MTLATQSKSITPLLRKCLIYDRGERPGELACARSSLTVGRKGVRMTSRTANRGQTSDGGGTGLKIRTGSGTAALASSDAA
jgi:hypothetical protein